MVWKMYVFLLASLAVTTSGLALSNQFAFDFLNSYKNGEDINMVFSPLSITMTFSALYTGSKANTRREIGNAFHYRDVKSGDFFRMIQEQQRLMSSQTNTVTMASKIWVEENVRLLQTFYATQRNFFGSEIGKETLKGHPEEARKRINKWVSNKTNGKVTDLFPQGSFNSLTSLVIANAIYFKELWKVPFEKKYTHKATFFMESGELQMTDFMWQNGYFPYKVTDNYTVLELPYKNNVFSMLLIVPRDNGKKISEVIKSMSNKKLDQLIATFRQRKPIFHVDVYLPKFKIEQQIDLKEALNDLGVKELFTPGKADFSGINGKHDLYCSDANHKAFIKVDESGTETGAATGVGASVVSMPKQVRFNQPFAFFIIHKDSNSIFFTGKVMNPATK